VDATAVWEHRASPGFTLAIGRDRLPRGVELGETNTILQDEIDQDRFPTQLKMCFDSSRAHLTAYAFAPGSTNAWGIKSHGGGALGEIPFLSDHIVLGGSVRAHQSEVVDRQTIGAFARLGFPTRRYVGYTQVFFAPEEWLVTSLVGERLVEPGTAQVSVYRWRTEVQARLSSHVTVTASARHDVTPRTNNTSRLYLVQVAIKTVQ
jgi:hypothetical protein